MKRINKILQAAWAEYKKVFPEQAGHTILSWLRDELHRTAEDDYGRERIIMEDMAAIKDMMKRYKIAHKGE